MNRTGKNIKKIAIHCSAGYGNLQSMRNFWRSKGWKSDGYHILVDLDGSLIQVVPFNLPSNGVKGFNSILINICYIGGVERTNVNKAFDSRTPQQRTGIINAINKALEWIRDTGGNIDQVEILGHRDFSPDKNGNGVIESWERIKECPSFDAKKEYSDAIQNFKKRNTASIEYVVRQGDTLFSIGRLHNTPVATLRTLNNLNNDILTIGQRLKIK